MEKKESWSTVGVEGTVLKSQGEEKQPTDSINLINIIVVKLLFQIPPHLPELSVLLLEILLILRSIKLLSALVNLRGICSAVQVHI